MSKRIIGRGAAFIYIETVTSMVFGYIFWIVMSKISSTDVIGESSAAISFAGIIAVIANLGIPTGIQRFLGKSFSEQRSNDVKKLIQSGIILSTLGVVVCIIVILFLKPQLDVVFRIDSNLLVIAMVLIGASVYSTLFRGIFIASLKTKILVPIMVISSIVKLVLGIILILLGFGALGLMLSFTVNQILVSVTLGILSLIVLKSSNSHFPSEYTILKASKHILTSSSVYWIPFLVTTIGSQLGTLVVFGTGGSSQAAVFFMSLTIVTGIAGVMYSLFTIALPVLSSMQDGRKRFAWQTIRLSLIIALPFSSSLIFYSEDIMRLLGNSYAEGSLSLQIMLISMLPVAATYGINSLVYSYGEYRKVLAIGFATSIPRTILYFIMVPYYGIAGAAAGYTLGAIAGFVLAVIIAHRIKMTIKWIDLLCLFLLPIIFGFVLHLLQVHYMAAILITLILSYLLLFRIGLVTRNDVGNFLDIMPNRLSKPISTTLQKIDKKLKNSFMRSK